MNHSAILSEILDATSKELKILPPTIQLHVLTTFQRCLDSALSNHIGAPTADEMLSIQSVLDYLHDELNTGHWSEISIEIRRNFSIASLVKSIFLIRASKSLSKLDLEASMKAIDLGILLGSPIDDTLVKVAAILKQHLSVYHVDLKRPSDDSNKDFIETFNNFSAVVIDEIELPSLETFNQLYFVPQKPVKLLNCISHWPATTKWLDLNYLLKVAGDRTVPIEIGPHYTHENWSQQLMTLKEFFKNHYLDEQNIGYLAQHNLFDQIPELRDDIRLPEYCCLSLDYPNATEPDINAWLGPKGTVSPLHQDPKNNLLCQIYGHKQVVLVAPVDSEKVYPHDETMLSNTARVDPITVDLDQYPEFKNVRLFKCLLGPGEMLFIPVKWWHHVMAFEKSFSVSFWWQ